MATPPPASTTQPTLSTTATASSHVADSPYTITASGAVDSDYTIRYVPGTLTVTQAALTITADDQTKVYGADLPTLTASYSGFVNGDTAASLTTQPTLTTTATATSSTDGGPYAITASGAVDSDYSISYVSGLLTVTPVPLTITADDQTKIYGADLPTLTASYSGFVNGDTPANLHIQPTLSTTATATSDTGVYAITASDALDPDYTISYVSGTLTISQATLTVTADDLTRPEGEVNPPLTFTFSGLVNGDTASVVSGTPILSTAATIASPNGQYPIDITAGTLSATNYDFITVGGTLTIENTPATMITITASPGSTSTYGQALSFTAIVSPTVSGDPTPTGTIQFEIDGVPIGSAVTLVNGSANSNLLSSPDAGTYTIEAIYSGDDNYATNLQTQTQTVNPALLTITAVDQSKVYGADVPTLTASYTGFVNGDNSASLTTLPTLSTTADVNSKVAGNPYTITASAAVDSNYTISYAPGILTVTPAPLTITADDQTMVYGGTLPALTVSYSGFENDDDANDLTTLPTVITTATANSHVSGNPYAITASGAVDPDYTISYVDGTLTVTPVALTITADNQTTVYGAALPALTASYTGFVNGDTSASLTAQPTLSTTATPSSHVAESPYTITASGAVDSDYTIRYAPGTMTVTQAALTITADDQTKAYGADLPTLTASYSGFVNGDTFASLTTQPTLTTTATATSSTDGGPYAITASGAVDSDYSISYVSGLLTVTPVPLTITADDQTKIYGADLPTLTASYSGFVNGDTPANLHIQPTLSTTATATSDTGVYAITASDALDPDYTISYVSGTLTISQATLTVTADDLTRPEGEANPPLTYTFSGLVNGDTASVVSGTPILSTAATIASPNGQYPIDITAGTLSATNYDFITVGGTLTIENTPATMITITASPGSTSTYGQALSFTAIVSPTVSGDPTPTGTIQFEIDGVPIGSAVTLVNGSANSNLLSSPDAGTYTIEAIYSGDDNYATNLQTQTQTVNPALLTITAVDQSKVYGADVPTLTASYSGLVNGDTSASLTTEPTLSTTATVHSGTGVYAITASGAVDSNYSITYVSGSLTVAAVPLLITAIDQTKLYGADLPALTASFTGFVNGDTSASLTTEPTLSTTATISSDVSGNPYTITASGAADSNYAISYASGILNVTPAELTITADNQTKAYGAALPTLTVSYSGFVAGDTEANLSTQPTLNTTAIASSHVGAYTITASGAVDTDYTISYVNGTLNVTSVALTITALDQTKLYGADVPALTVSYAGFVNGDTSANLTTQPTLATTATASSHVSGNPYTITASSAVDPDYSITYVGGSLTVTSVPLLITADNQTKVYGATLPVLTASYSGFVNGDTSVSLTTQPTLSTTALATSDAGAYPITASGAADSDYTISYAAGTLTVTQAPLLITADNQTKVYGAELPTLTASYTGFVNGDTAADLDTGPTLSTTATTTSDTGDYVISVSGAADIDYAITFRSGTLTVTPADLLITADNLDMVYGAALPTLTASYSGFVNGDTSGSLTTQPTLTTTATASSHVAGNSYPITASGAAGSNYTISYLPGSLTVTPAALTVIVNNQTKGYGEVLPVLTASYSGFVNGDTSASLTTLPALSTTATASSHVSGNPYAITASGAVDSDYSFTYLPGTLTVTPVALTITAVYQTKVYGAALPTLTASYAGFVNGDTSASLTTQPTLTTTATADSHVAGNPYAITAGGAADFDYSITYVAGSLTVTTAPLTITADSQTKVYGAALPALTVSYSGFVASDTAADLSTPPTISTTATAQSDTGDYAITASGAVDTDYAISYVSGTLAVSPATLTVTADNLTRPPGEPNPPLTYTISGWVNVDTSSVESGMPTLSTTATITSPEGEYPIAVAVGSLSAANYDFTTVDGTLTVANNTAITIGPATLPVGTVGDPYTQQLTATGGSGTGYRFTATGLPAGLSLSATGLLSGTPASALDSPFTVDVTVTDSDGGTGSRNYSLTVEDKTITGIIVTSLAQTYYGQEVTLTATFTATPAGPAPMTGTAAFYNGNTYLGTEPLFSTGDPSGTSMLSTSSLSVGGHLITAVYSGDANYSTATVVAPVAVDVLQAVTATTLTAATSSQGLTLTANVVVTSPGNPPLVGSVSFYENGTLIATEPVSNGVASLNVSSLPPANYSFSAVFGGGANSLASESSLVVTTNAPQVESLARYGFHRQPTYLLLYFNGPLDPSSAQNPLNYRIVAPGGQRITVSSAIYDSATHTVTLVPAERLNVHRRYLLTVNGTAPSGLTNPSGVLLDGAHNGKAGSNYVTWITWKNLKGRASKLPTLGLVDAARAQPANTQTSPHPAAQNVSAGAIQPASNGRISEDQPL